MCRTSLVFPKQSVLRISIRSISSTGMHKTIQLANQRLCGTQAVLVLHNPFDADYTVVRVGINTVIVQHSHCMTQSVYDIDSSAMSKSLEEKTSTRS